MMIGKLLRLGRRQLHTIISREKIKPSSPTPSHLQSYNLSPIDQLTEHLYMPLILFYPNNRSFPLSAHDKSNLLKKSLSQSLTKYYPFAGTLHTPTTSYIDCNDEGVVFLEAKHDTQLDMLQYMNKHDQNLHQLFADDMVCRNSPSSTSILGVKLNHFACGGVGVAISLSHIIADASTALNFLSHWASVSLYGSTDHKEVLPLSPHIIHFPRCKSIQSEAHHDVINQNQGYNNFATRRFVFPNSKLSELKNKVVALAAAAGSTLDINNITRVEALASLLYTTAVKSATAKNGFFKPSCLSMAVDVRMKFVKNLPQTTMGNCFTDMTVTTKDTSEASLNVVVEEIKRNKIQLQQVQSLEQAAENMKMLRAGLGITNSHKELYVCSSICGFPYNKVNFGWGNPAGATIPVGSTGINGLLFMDTPDGDGIEVLVFLEKEDMEIFENDKETLSFCQINQM